MAMIPAALGGVGAAQPTHLAPLPRLLAYTQRLGLARYLVRPKRADATLALALLWLVLVWQGSGRASHLDREDQDDPLLAALRGVERVPCAKPLARRPDVCRDRGHALTRQPLAFFAQATRTGAARRARPRCEQTGRRPPPAGGRGGRRPALRPTPARHGARSGRLLLELARLPDSLCSHQHLRESLPKKRRKTETIAAPPRLPANHVHPGCDTMASAPLPFAARRACRIPADDRIVSLSSHYHPILCVEERPVTADQTLSTPPPAIDDRALDEVALTRDEYDRIVALLGRVPNRLELGLFGAMWSEHCGYKNSRPLLKRFPTTGPRVTVKAGEENAGAVDIGDGLAIVMKIESHNHPSAVEPYQGAATGVGGIVRDIFTMGARPIALLDSLRFGPLDDPRNRYLFSGVVGGVGGYGNCLGIPTVGGEIYFDATYSGNPLVNAMCVGILESGRLIPARAEGPGNPILVVGAATGRDGIHGATFASVELDEASEERRPAVQVGNPFTEKLLMEACLELRDAGWIVGMQDLGAAGLTSSTVEAAHKGRSGIELDVLLVPRRESGMTPYDVMLSESQERMLVVARAGCEERVRALFARWGLHSEVIGRVLPEEVIRVKEGSVVVAEVPTALLTDAVPAYTREGVPPPELAALWAFDTASLAGSLPPPEDALLRLLASPDLSSREHVYRTYDTMVGTNTLLGPGSDAAVLRVRDAADQDTGKAIALATDGNGRLTYLDPDNGGALAVAEAARNVVCAGATPLALTNCLNFGNPERPEIYYQLAQAVDGMAAAARALETPVISGNVSLYNESFGRAIYPTPVVGMLGLLEGRPPTPSAFQHEGDFVVLLGDLSADPATLGGSTYLAALHGVVAGRPPRLDLDRERALQRLVLAAIAAGHIRSAHDCSDGGLAVALAECCLWSHLGLTVDAGALPLHDPALGAAALLFGEAPSRIVASISPDRFDALAALAAIHGVPLTRLGIVGGSSLSIPDLCDLPVVRLYDSWRNGLARTPGQVSATAR